MKHVSFYFVPFGKVMCYCQRIVNMKERGFPRSRFTRLRTHNSARACRLPRSVAATAKNHDLRNYFMRFLYWIYFTRLSINITIYRSKTAPISIATK